MESILFLQRDYSATIVDNIPFYPDPSPIIQVVAVDADEGANAELHFTIVEGNERKKFFIDPQSGVVYPNTSFIGLTGEQFTLTVQVNKNNKKQAIA